MPKKLSIKEQRALIKALPMHRKMAVKAHCQSCAMKGQGIKDVLKTVGKTLGDIAKELGPTVMKELVIPYFKKKYVSGKGLRTAGSGLRLAGKKY